MTEKMDIDEKQHVKARECELDRLVMAMVGQAPTECLLADIMLEVLDLKVPIRPCSADCTSNATPRLHGNRFYPPIYRRGPIDDHDRPFAEYGHTNSVELNRLCRFDFVGKKTKQILEQIDGPLPKRSLRTWAIQCYSRFTKSDMIDHIKWLSVNQNDPLQYVCISEPMFVFTESELYHLNIQIIFKKRKVRCLNFLERYVVGQCNYAVTTNEFAWNEYLKKDHNFLEFGDFKSPKKLEPLYWCHTLPVMGGSSKKARARRPKRPIVKMSDDLFRNANYVVQRVMTQAIDDVRRALGTLCTLNPVEYMRYKQWFLLVCQYIHLREQHAIESGDEKHTSWPISFPNCSIQLRQTIDHWLQHEFVKNEHGKCLILIGPRGCGKSTFARSLPGPINYFDETTADMKSWSNFARYAVFDNIAWDQFEIRNYPDRKQLLTQSGTTITLNDFFLDTFRIHLTQPSIVLLTIDETEGSLKSLYDPSMPLRDIDRMNAHSWIEHAIIYRLGEEDHFYLPSSMATDNVLPISPLSITDISPPSSNCC